MAIVSRSDLISRFSGGIIPTGSDFCDLIQSSINQKDDCFRGKWRKNYKYNDGDVVLYGKSMYRLVIDAIEEECPDDQVTPTPVQPTVEVSSSEAELTLASKKDMQTEGESTEAICSVKPPDKDDRWCMLEFQIEDDDWEILDIDGVCVLSPKKDGTLIGIGTGDQSPTGAIEINVPDKGQIILAPNDEVQPAIQIQKNKNIKGTIQIGDSHMEHVTQTPAGFAFFKNTPISEPKKSKSTKKPATRIPIMVVDANGKGQPRVGIGTAQPQASVDAKIEGKGQVLIQPGTKADPEIVMVNLDPKYNENYLATSVGENAVKFETDAEGGFQFHKGEEYRRRGAEEKNNTSTKLEDPSLMTISSEGKVGIGTDSPMTHLEVKDETKGTFQMSFEKVNPVFSIINRRPGLSNFMSIGADNNCGVLITNSIGGIKIKQASSDVKNEHTPDINFGSDLMTITPDAKVGVGKTPDYHLDVAGKIQTNGVYLETDSSKIDVVSTLKDSLKNQGQTAVGKICQMNPVIFNFKPTINVSGDGPQLGLVAHEVADLFPETVQTNNRDKSQSVAYGNLVAALVEAIKEQQTQINDLTSRIQKIEMNKYNR